MHTDAGHRQRVKNRFCKEGLDSFEEVHALELLLFYAVPRIDTKPMARSLLDRFGSLALVLEATQEELMAVPGVGANIATFLTLITAAGRYYRKQKADQQVILESLEKYGDYLLNMFHGKRNETVYLLCLDSKFKVLCCREVGEGDANSVNVPIRKAVEICKEPCRSLLLDCAMIMTGCNASADWLTIYQSLPRELQGNGRLQLYTAIAHMNCGNTAEAKEILNESFAMADIKEGELSISAVWAELYGAEKPLPKHLNFRMHETKE